MKYSYSPTTGLQSGPSTSSAHRPSLSQSAPPPPSLPQRPASQYSYPVQSPPPTSPHYASFPGSQPYSPPPVSPVSPLHSPPAAARPAPSRPSTGYSPVNFDSPHAGGATPEQFYGSLIDRTTSRPTEVFSRLADAFFFWMDGACEVPGLRGTGVVEPAKYGWMSHKIGASTTLEDLLESVLPSYYEMASIPHRYVQTPQGALPVLDRRGWLHLCVYDARSDPTVAHQHLSKAVTLFGLVDPATHTPFPTPLPRAALPAYAEPALAAQLAAWRTQAVLSLQRARTDAMVQNIMNAARPQYNPYAAFMGGAGAGGATNYFANQASAGQSQGNSGGGGGGDGEHASVLDTVNTLGTLANTILGVVNGGAGIGGGGGFGTGTGTGFFDN